MLEHIAGPEVGSLNKTTPLAPIYFDPQRRAGNPSMRAAADALVAHLERREVDLKTRTRARRDKDRQSFRLAVEAIACNLAWLVLFAADRFLAVPRSSGVMWATGRYGNPVYGQHFLDALDLMALPEVGLIETPTMGYRFASGEGRSSTIVPTATFKMRFPLEGADGTLFARATEPEVLILKGRKAGPSSKAEPLDYKDTENTRRLRKAVQAINAFLETASFGVARSISAVGDGSDGQPIDPSRRALRRIFNNGSWYEGGRLFGGFWETMRRGERFKRLRIGTKGHPDGERVANVDFGQLFPTLAYHQEPHAPPDSDLYDVLGNGMYREGFKTLVNSLLFAVKPMNVWPRHTASLFPKGTKLRDVLAQINRYHAPIADLFGTGIGFRLMRIESQMLIEALNTLYHERIVALPLHDSVLVGASEAEHARGIMSDVSHQFSEPFRAKLKVDYGEEYQKIDSLRLL